MSDVSFVEEIDALKDINVHYRLKINYNEKAINSFNDPNLNAKSFWKQSKTISGDESENSIPPLRENNNLVPDDPDKATYYNDYLPLYPPLTLTSQYLNYPTSNYLPNHELTTFQQTNLKRIAY